MNVKVPLGLLLLLAVAVGYLLGTEKGRGQRDMVMGKIRERQSDTEVVDLTEAQATEEVPSAEDVSDASAPSS